MAESIDQERSAHEVSKTTDCVVAVFLMIVAAAAIFWLIPVYVVDARSEYDLTPRTFPYLTAIVIFGLAGLTVISMLRLPRRDKFSNGGLSISFEFSVWLLILTLAVLGLYYIGFLPVAIALMFAGMYLTHYRRYGPMLLIAVALPIILERAVWYIFSIHLP